MSIESIGAILKSLERGAAWQPPHEFDVLVRCWSEVVGALVSQHAHPVELRHGCLWVATSNGVWAQQLRFECPRILTKLNRQLPLPLQEIRFSPARWHQRPANATEPFSSGVASHPSRRSSQMRCESSRNPLPQLQRELAIAHTSQTAFQQWANQIQARSRGLPLCPQCGCPTPVGELQHWSRCALCAVKPDRPMTLPDRPS